MRAVLHMLMLLLALVAPGGAIAVQPSEVLPDAGLEKRARSLSAELRCLVCQNQSIDDSDAPLAKDLRLLVRERLVAGDSDSEVLQFLVARYGEFVLLRPTFGVHTLVLWLTPVVLLGLALLGIAWRVFGSRQPAPAPAPLSPDEQRRLAGILNAPPEK